MPSGMVSDIQRFSLHDGPGIRTNVYLKGCNLHCGWCHNPETISGAAQIQFFSSRCIGCGKCVEACRYGALRIDGDGPRVFEAESCVGCGACAKECMPRAMVLNGQRMDVDEVMEQVRIDAPYYRRSSGGLTVTGGEPLMQPEFTLALLKSAQAEGFSAAIETNLSLPWMIIEPIAQCCDLIMFDIKTMDTHVHQHWTGQGNETVLHNAKRLNQMGIPFIVRTPLIPGVNDQEEDIVQIARFVKDLENLSYYELLPYNPLAHIKFNELGMAYGFAGTKTQDKSTQRRLLRAARSTGVVCRLMEDEEGRQS